jgi:hypothetical protein
MTHYNFVLSKTPKSGITVSVCHTVIYATSLVHVPFISRFS